MYNKDLKHTLICRVPDHLYNYVIQRSEELDISPSTFIRMSILYFKNWKKSDDVKTSCNDKL